MKTFGLLFVILFSLSIAGFSQCSEANETDQANCENLQRLKDQIKSNSETRESKRLFIPDLLSRLPEGEEAWIIGVLQNGGWAGPYGSLKATVESNGNYLCRKDAKFLTFKAESERFEPISKLLRSVIFPFIQTNDSDESSSDDILMNFGQISVATTRLIVVKRETRLGKKQKKHSKVNVYKYKMTDFLNDKSSVRQIYDAVNAAVNCDIAN